jgi:hypothetical protein
MFYLFLNNYLNSIQFSRILEFHKNEMTVFFSFVTISVFGYFSKSDKKN